MNKMSTRRVHRSLHLGLDKSDTTTETEAQIAQLAQLAELATTSQLVFCSTTKRAARPSHTDAKPSPLLLFRIVSSYPVCWLL